MLKILDRYLLRELMAPFGFALLLLTFALEIPPILDYGESLISEGASWDVVVRVLATLVPQALGITIPMALLFGVLFTLGRLSGDREIVAMEACGVSIARLLRPMLLFAVIATASTTYVMIVALPAANQAFREITFKLLMTRGETKIKPRIFYTDFPSLVIYVREVTPGVGWSSVFVTDTSLPNEPKLYLSKTGRLLLNEEKRTVQMVLTDGTHHFAKLDEPEKYESGTFKQTTLIIDPESVFPRQGPMKGLMEMTIAELKKDMAELRAQNIHPHNQIMAWQKKYSIPAACLAFMLVALGLGVSNRRDGKLAAFVVGIGVVFVYWLLLYLSEAVAKGGLFPWWFAWVAMWVPNIVVLLWGAILVVKKLRAPEESAVRFALPFLRRRAAGNQAGAAGSRGTKVVVVIKVPQITLPRLSILDWYVLKHGLRVAGLAAVGLLGLFYIASFIDLSNHLFTGRTTGLMILRYLWWASPQFGYYLVPLAVLMGALVTIGALTKNSELIVMRACGISLSRRVAAADSRDARQRDPHRARRRCARLLQPARRYDQQPDSRAPADDPGTESPVGDGEQRQHLPVPVFRARPEPAEWVVDL
jgi:LPS export ABC transporter permease LptF